MNSWIERARQLSNEVLAPQADTVDATGAIPPGHFDLLAANGFYGVTLSDDLDLATFTEVGETLVAACLATTFVWAQHLGAARRIATSPNHGLRDRLTEDLRRGRVRCGVSYAGADDRADLSARRVDGGFVLDGVAPFVTGWGLVDVLAVMARDEADPHALISVLVPAQESSALAATPMILSAVDASRTATLRFDGLFVPDSDVDNRLSLRGFHASSILAIWRNGSMALGLVRRCRAELDARGIDTGGLVHESGLIRTELDDALSGQSDIAHARARASELAVLAASGLVTAVGSAAAQRGGIADRTVREAAFTLIFGSRPPIRAALLDRLVGSGETR
ncbi:MULTISPECIES: acyl-CoA dehydrogenase family protein [Nocardia]|uniref:acyl-CoA dehydrogenase family protein n=1 Tax=Nocardia TaxID=1817 RepID=UPI000D68E13B|nr:MULTISPECIES: acyl-CoA dehydrogenase family protein [Nocardia]